MTWICWLHAAQDAAHHKQHVGGEYQPKAEASNDGNGDPKVRQRTDNAQYEGEKKGQDVGWFDESHGIAPC